MFVITPPQPVAYLKKCFSICFFFFNLSWSFLETIHKPEANVAILLVRTTRKLGLSSRRSLLTMDVQGCPAHYVLLLLIIIFVYWILYIIYKCIYTYNNHVLYLYWWIMAPAKSWGPRAKGVSEENSGRQMDHTPIRIRRCKWTFLRILGQTF